MPGLSNGGLNIRGKKTKTNCVIGFAGFRLGYSSTIFMALVWDARCWKSISAYSVGPSIGSKYVLWSTSKWCFIKSGTWVSDPHWVAKSYRHQTSPFNFLIIGDKRTCWILLTAAPHLSFSVAKSSLALARSSRNRLTSSRRADVSLLATWARRLAASEDFSAAWKEQDVEEFELKSESLQAGHHGRYTDILRLGRPPMQSTAGCQPTPQTIGIHINGW